MQEPVEIEFSGLKLRGNFYKPHDEAKKLAILFLHGWTGTPNEAAAKLISENGFYAMTIALSGHGHSEGKLEDQTREKSLQEVLAAYDFFRQKLPENVKIGVAGNSYGGYFGAVLSGERELACIQMRVPANYWDDGADEPQLGRGHDDPNVMNWRRQAQDASATRSLRALHNFHGPVQIIEAEFDDAIPHQVVQNYMEAVKDKSKLDYHFMKDWPHSLADDPERNRQYQTILLNWLNKQVE
jgi:esterase/lipase